MLKNETVKWKLHLQHEKPLRPLFLSKTVSNYMPKAPNFSMHYTCQKLKSFKLYDNDNEKDHETQHL